MRSRILSTKPLPYLRAAFSEVCQEESRRRVMLGLTQPISAASDCSALTTHRQPPSTVDTSDTPVQNSSYIKGKPFWDRPWCSKCKKSNHTINTCWQIHGKPADWKPARERRANANATVSDYIHKTRCPSHASKWRFLHGFLARNPSQSHLLPLNRVILRPKVISRLPFHLSVFPHILGLLTPEHPII